MMVRSGSPCAKRASRTSLMAVSMPSEPPFVKKTWSRPGGASSLSLAASSIDGSFEKSQNDA
jgi:hypothetical protein